MQHLTIKVTTSETTQCSYSGGNTDYLSSQGVSSILINPLDLRIQYQLSLSTQPNTRPFQGYTLSLMRLPGRECVNEQERFYQKRFVGSIVSKVNFKPKTLHDGKLIWLTDDGQELQFNRSYELTLQFYQRLSCRWWQKRQIVPIKVNCRFELATFDDYQKWQPYMLNQFNISSNQLKLDTHIEHKSNLIIDSSLNPEGLCEKLHVLIDEDLKRASNFCRLYVDLQPHHKFNDNDWMIIPIGPEIELDEKLIQVASSHYDAISLMSGDYYVERIETLRYITKCLKFSENIDYNFDISKTKQKSNSIPENKSTSNTSDLKSAYDLCKCYITKNINNLRIMGLTDDDWIIMPIGPSIKLDEKLIQGASSYDEAIKLVSGDYFVEQVGRL